MAEPVGPDLLGTGAAGPAAIRGGTIRVAGYALAALLSAGAAALLFRHLGVVGTGRYVTALSVVAVVGGLSDLGLTAVGVRELSVRQPSEREAFVRNLLGLRIVLAAGGVLLACLFGLVAGYAPAVVAGIGLAGIGMVAQSVQGTLAVSLTSSLRLGWVTVADLVRQLATVVLIVILVAAGAHLLPFLAIPIPAGLAALALTAALLRGELGLRPAFDRSHWRVLLRLVLPYAGAVAAATIYFRLAIILVSLIASGRQLGYFGASFRIVEVLIAVPGLAVGAAFPILARAARDDPARLRYGLGRAFEVSLILGAGISVTLALGARVAIDAVGGPGFAPAVPVLAIQGIAVGAAFVGAVWGYALLSLARYRDILRINLGALVVGGATVAALVSLDGARGAALGTAIGELTLAVVGALVLARGNRDLLPSPAILPRVALATALGLAPALIPGVTALPRTGIGVVLFALALAAVGAMPVELRELLRPRRARV